MKTETAFILRAGAIKMGLVAMFVLYGVGASCPSQPVAVKQAEVKLAVEVCKELARGGDAPEWAYLACDTAGGVALVVMPRRQWQEMQVADVDAGPGK